MDEPNAPITSLDRMNGILDRAAALIQSAADLKAAEPDVLNAETRYLESLALELASLMESPAVRDMPIERFTVTTPSGSMFKRGTSHNLFRRTMAHGSFGYGNIFIRETNHLRPLAWGEDGRLWVASPTKRGSFEPVGDALPEEIAFSDMAHQSDLYNQGRYSTRLATIVPLFESLVAECRQIHENALAKARERMARATGQTRS